MQINSDFEFQIKLVIIGDSGVGKIILYSNLLSVDLVQYMLQQ